MDTMDMTTWMERLTPYFFSALYALVIFWVGRLLAKWVTSLVGRLMERAKVDATLVRFASNLVYIALMAFVILAALQKLGIQTTYFIAVIGAAGLAVGLALQGSLSNFASGVLMIVFKPFKVGDFIDGAGTSGVVEEIGIFNTTLHTPDNKLIIIPNSAITGGNITNFSAKPTRRIDLVLGVSYSDDLKKVRSVLEAILEDDARILKDPAYTVAVSELADSSVNFVVRPWVNGADYWGVRFDLTEKIKLRFDEEGISIPFPQRSLHIVNGSQPAA